MVGPFQSCFARHARPWHATYGGTSPRSAVLGRPRRSIHSRFASVDCSAKGRVSPSLRLVSASSRGTGCGSGRGSCRSLVVRRERFTNGRIGEGTDLRRKWLPEAVPRCGPYLVVGHRACALVVHLAAAMKEAHGCPSHWDRDSPCRLGTGSLPAAASALTAVLESHRPKQSSAAVSAPGILWTRVGRPAGLDSPAQP